MSQDGAGPISLGSGMWGAAQLDSSSPHRVKQHSDTPHYARLAHSTRAVGRGLPTDPGGAGVTGAPLGGALY